jgi:hypothetical protein
MMAISEDDDKSDAYGPQGDRPAECDGVGPGHSDDDASDGNGYRSDRNSGDNRPRREYIDSDDDEDDDG